MDWLELSGKKIVVVGVADKHSVGYHIGKRLQKVGAKVLWVCHTEARRDELEERLDGPIYVCDVEREDELEKLRDELGRDHPQLHGLVHSIAFADYSGGPRPFHQTKKRDFLRAIDVSAFSLVNLADKLREYFVEDASVVTISISTTRMAAENYGPMGPVKAALDSAVVFLAKSFSGFSRIRFNAVGAGPLKTSASAGIPGYLKSYLFAERCTLRKAGLKTEEVADTALFLLSPRSAGINATGITVDAGMAVNYFNDEVVESVTRLPGSPGPSGGTR